METVVNRVECSDHIIQVKLLNVEKNSLFVSDIFKDISVCGVNIDMISQIMLEDEMRIDFTCDRDDQVSLNKALDMIKEKHPRMEVFQNRKVAKVMVEGHGMKNAVGVAANIFEVFGEKQIPLYQVTTSDISISYVIPKEMMGIAVEGIKKLYHL